MAERRSLVRTFRIYDKDYKSIPSGTVRGTYRGITNEVAERFSAEMLGLGNLERKSKSFMAICAFFDLQGFTRFMAQTDAELSIPEFMSKYLKWFFERIKDESIHERTPEGLILWHEISSLHKIPGDGFMVIWDTQKLDQVQQTNIVASCNRVCGEYSTTFRNSIVHQIVDTPRVMRCGIAKGWVFSVGDDADFVGPVVNLAARLQKLGSFTFAWSNKGFRRTRTASRP